MQWKQRYRLKQYRSMTCEKSAFSPASGPMTLNSVWLQRHRIHGNSNKRWCKRRFEPSQETDVKKMINGNVSAELIYKSHPKLRLSSGLTLTKSTRTVICKTYLFSTSHPAVHMLRRKWQFQFGNIRKITQNSNLKRHYLEKRWSYRRKFLHNNIEDQVQWHISKLFILLAL